MRRGAMELVPAVLPCTPDQGQPAEELLSVCLSAGEWDAGGARPLQAPATTLERVAGILGSFCMA